MPAWLLIAVGALGFILIIFIGYAIFIASFYKKVSQGKALVRTGWGKNSIDETTGEEIEDSTKVTFSGMYVIPLFHKAEVMDISVKKVEIQRLGKDGLICKDNMRADIKVAFFVRVNPEVKDVKKVAQTIGCERASDIGTLNTLFEAKFSEALKTVGKKFDFIELYDSRAEFKSEILEIIGRDLNGYALDDCAIDYLEQTPVQFLKKDNILDSEGIKKITQLTADQNILANKIKREEEKTITEQDVEAKEAILELNRQLAEKVARQEREIANVQARETSEIDKVNEEERLKSTRAKIQTEEELGVALANKERQIIVAQKNKERTDVIETERVDKDRLLEVNEKERIVTLAQIEKEKAIEEEKKRIQEIVSERVMVDKKVAIEEEKIKDVRALAEADREKSVMIKMAEQKGETLIITTTKKAEAEKLAAEVNAQKVLIDAKAKQEAAEREAEARKIYAEATAKEEATIGLAEAEVIIAKAAAKEKDGSVEAIVLEKTLIAEAKGIELKAEAERKKGLAEAEVILQKGNNEAEVWEKQALAEAKGIEQRGLAEAVGLEKKGLAEANILERQVLAEAKGIEQKGLAEAKGIEQKGLAEAKSVSEKAKAMQELNEVGKDHEEFKLRLEQQTKIELAKIGIQKDISEAQALILAEAFKSANIEIIGGEQDFFNNMMKAINQGKYVDRVLDNSTHLTDLKSNLLSGDTNLIDRVKGFVQSAGLKTEDIRNLTLSALLMQLHGNASDSDKSVLGQVMDMVKSVGIGGQEVGKLF